jgi:hypothetical protein
MKIKTTTFRLMEEAGAEGGGGGGTLMGGDFTAPAEPAPEAPPAEPAPAEGGFTAPSWMEGLEVDAELAGDPSLKAIQDVPSLIKSYVHAQKKMGMDKAVLPTKDSSNEEWMSLYHKLGLPTEFDNYGVEAGEDAATSEEFVNEFAKTAFENNILPQQAQSLLKFVNEQANTQANLLQEQQQEALSNGINAIKEEWGDAFDENVHKAKLAVKEFGGEELSKYLNETGMGNDPQLIKAFSKIGKEFFKEDNFAGGEKPAYAMSPSEAQEKIGKIQGDYNGPYYNSMNPDHKRVVAEVNKLFQIAHAKGA